jgi:hypothetical protein
MKRCPFCAEDVQDAAIVCKHCGRDLNATEASTNAAVSGTTKPLVTRTHVVVGIALFGLMWVGLGRIGKPLDAVQTPPRAPITLQEVVQNVPAHSWKALSLDLPYSGNLRVDLHVVNGNPLDVVLLSESEFEILKSQDDGWSKIRVYTGFNATKTKAFARSAFMNPGGYYLVMRDTSLGVLSSAASDVSVKATLNP